MGDGKYYTDKVEVRLAYDWVLIPGTIPKIGNPGHQIEGGGWTVMEGRTKTWVFGISLTKDLPKDFKITGNVGYQMATSTSTGYSIDPVDLPQIQGVAYKAEPLQLRVRKYFVHVNPPPPGKVYDNYYGDDEILVATGARYYKKTVSGSSNSGQGN